MVGRLNDEERPRLVAAPRGAPDGEHWATSWGAARDGARIVMTRVQASALVLLAALGAVLVGTIPRYALIVCLGILTALYFATGVHKIWLLIRGELAGTGSAADSHHAEADELPFYTVLVPLYREGRILPALVERLKRIDYPPERLEVLLLIESDDEETRSAANRYPFPPSIRPMLMPLGQPRTKPRALNIALQAARGEYIVVLTPRISRSPTSCVKRLLHCGRCPWMSCVCRRVSISITGASRFSPACSPWTTPSGTTSSCLG